ncbi:MAG: MFS transporter [Candidatus Cloacimonetes bacterium]|jgi:MFS family permease|nr:MFS transporter [Candidatus Cloacimonadota bacterium]MDD4277384.1 MFS transporter [Candidatus Cloacimonadota bacterium]MDY0324773.1 MFS transporter [Candidatus Cloacimonadaceae bacterium]
MKFKELNPSVRHTVLLLMVAAVFNGAIQSLGQTQDIIARKALLAQDWQLMLMTMISPISNFLSIWWGRLFERSRHKSRYFLLAGVFGRLVLVYAIWLTTMNEYLVIMGMMFSANSLLIPAQNTIYQKNIRDKRRAWVFGYALSIGVGVSIALTYVAGRLLDNSENSFRWILAITGAAGFISCFLLSRIKINQPLIDIGLRKPKIKLRDVFLDPILRTRTLLKENKPFACFERSFTLYGMGFIMMQPIIPIYMVDKLQLSYTNNFMAKGILSQIGMLLLSPVLGKLHDKMHPLKYIGFSFALLMVFPLLFVLSSIWAGESAIAVAIVFLAYSIFGVAMTGVNMAWNMSSIFFAGTQDAAMYQSVHVTLSGVRGLMAPVLGFALLRLVSIESVFIVAAGFLATASFMSFRDYHRIKYKSVDIIDNLSCQSTSQDDL